MIKSDLVINDKNYARLVLPTFATEPFPDLNKKKTLLTRSFGLLFPFFLLFATVFLFPRSPLFCLHDTRSNEVLCKSLLLDEGDHVVTEGFASRCEEIADQGLDLGVQRMNGMPLAQKSCHLSLKSKTTWLLLNLKTDGISSLTIVIMFNKIRWQTKAELWINLNTDRREEVLAIWSKGGVTDL